ncbi:MAG: type II toxin-antitoxin system PemK/MazF family toxin [Candidatus Dormiibacterota bacterium]
MSVRSLRWAVLSFRLDPVEGHEQSGRRPCLVVSYEPFHRSGLVTVIPITSARTEERFPGDVGFPSGTARLARAGVVIGSQVRTVLALRTEMPPAGVGYVTEPHLRRRVRDALAHHLGLDLPPASDGAQD